MEHLGIEPFEFIKFNINMAVWARKLHYTAPKARNILRRMFKGVDYITKASPAGKKYLLSFSGFRKFLYNAPNKAQGKLCYHSFLICHKEYNAFIKYMDDFMKKIRDSLINA